MSKEASKTEEVNTKVLFNTALLNVKNKLTAVAKDAKNPFFKSNYTTLNAYLLAIEPLLKDEGLFLTQPLTSNGTANFVRTVITQASTGELVESAMMLPAIDDPQKLGGAITYFRRYTLASLLGTMSADDDGETAMGRSNTKAPARKSSNF